MYKTSIKHYILAERLIGNNITATARCWFIFYQLSVVENCLCVKTTQPLMTLICSRLPHVLLEYNPSDPMKHMSWSQMGEQRRAKNHSNNFITNNRAIKLMITVRPAPTYIHNQKTLVPLASGRRDCVISLFPRVISFFQPKPTKCDKPKHYLLSTNVLELPTLV